MSRRRRRPLLEQRPCLPPAAPTEPVGLLRKYQELLAKHTALVQKLELRTSERISSQQLSSWAMETSASALALLADDVVLMANPRWHQLCHGGPWRRVHPGPAQPACTLRQAAQAASAALSTLGEQQPLVERYREPAGGRTVELRVARVPTATGSLTQRAVLVQVLDITTQALAERELEETRAALARQEHLRSLGELASGMAHDLNNTLNAMRLRLEMLGLDAASITRQRGHLEALGRIVDDASLRVRRLQEFSRHQAEPLNERLQLADVIHGAVELARSELEDRAARSGVPLKLQVDLPVLPLVAGSATDLRYVFINLLLNARDAMPHGGTIRVSGSQRGSKVLITVEDGGTGIREEHLNTIFQPFFTTKGAQGTGLGLSMAYNIMMRLEGSISAANRAQGGAVFTLSFPTAAPLPAPPPLEALRAEAVASRRPKRPARSRSRRR